MKYLAKTTQDETWLEKENRKIALMAAVEGMVLLENDGVLPLRKRGKIALFGNGARKTIKGGTGSGDVNERNCITVEIGLENAGFSVVTKKWLDRYDQIWENDRLSWKRELENIAEKENKPFVLAYLETLHLLPTIDVEPEELADAELAIYVIGRRSGEGIDRVAEKGDYYLSEEEIRGLRLIKSYYQHLIIVINAGGPVDTDIIKCEIHPSALIVMSQAGMEGGNALARILTGEESPSGKLSDTWAKQYLDYPEADNFSAYSRNPHEIFYREGIYVGYRYFETAGKQVSYPFGYGKSYTSFQISPVSYRIGETGIEFVCRVKNMGVFQGKEVVQIYVRAPQQKLPKPSRVLAGYIKTKILQPGEEEECVIKCELSVFSSFDQESSQQILESGIYEFYIGNSVRDTIPGWKMILEKEIVLFQSHKYFPLTKKMEEWELAASEEENNFEYCFTIDGDLAEKLQENIKRQDTSYCKTKLSRKDQNMLAELPDEKLINLVIGAAREEQRDEVGNASENVPGAAGQTSAAIDDIPPLILADGGSGLRLLHHFQTDERGCFVEINGMAALERGVFSEKTGYVENAVDYYQYCTAFPIGTMLAQTWNEKVCEEVGKAVGREMKEFGVQIWLAPSINIHRNPLCGRNFEYYSEDPFLTGSLAAAVCRGVMLNSGTAVTIKHFAANNQELYRHSSDSIVSERALREIYLKPFEFVIKKAHPLAIMTSYNCLNGTQTANRKDLCTDVARNEWGFDGLIMTDWGTTDPGSSDPVVCIQCGNDLVMPGGIRDRQRLLDARKNGKLGREQLELAAEHIVSVVRRLKD